MWKEKNIVMLPTDNISDIILGVKASTFNAPMIHRKDIDSEWEKFGTNQHFYIISDEEIKKGDWYIDDTNTIRQAVISDKEYWKARQDYKKIIATTDTELVYGDNVGTFYHFPEIPESFIHRYIEEYNKGNIIEKVEVEYESAFNIPTIYDFQQLLISSFNTINIRLKKDIVYTEEKVKQLVFRAYNLRTQDSKVRSTKSLEDWFEQNKKK